MFMRMTQPGQGGHARETLRIMPTADRLVERTGDRQGDCNEAEASDTRADNSLHSRQF